MLRSFIIMLVCLFNMQTLTAQESGVWIRINQLGYLPGDIKVAVMISKEETNPGSFRVLDVKTGECVFSGSPDDGFMKKAPAEKWAMATAFRLNFTNLKDEGGYEIVVRYSGKVQWNLIFA